MKKVFYPLSKFKIYKDILFFKRGGNPIKFPNYLMLSENYFHRGSTCRAK